MDSLVEALAWLADPARWQGADGVPARLAEHAQLSTGAVLAGLAVALPAGLAIGHVGRGAAVVLAIATLGRAIPSFALLLFFFPFFGLNWLTGFLPLVLLAIPPIIVNAHAGVRGVDRETVEASRGMGMGELEILARIELPLALPVVIAGVRTAAVQVVATATLVAIVAGGGLGRYIVDGFARQEYSTRLLAGAILVALVAIATDRVLGAVEARSLSPGMRRAGGSR